jgi:hypothetical protein
MAGITRKEFETALHCATGMLIDNEISDMDIITLLDDIIDSYDDS